LKYLGAAYNTPSLCFDDAWTEANGNIVGNHRLNASPSGVFVDDDTNVYSVGNGFVDISESYDGNVDFFSHQTAIISNQSSIFVNTAGHIYISDNQTVIRIQQWQMNKTTTTVVMNTSGQCSGLFIDLRGNLYCSIKDLHKVMISSLNNIPQDQDTLVSVGTNDTNATMLNYPRGIFVDTEFRLFVADTGNHRIQRFEWNSTDGTTIAGNSSSPAITLIYPLDVILDSDGYLFIVAAGPGSLDSVGMLSFDNKGNLYVTQTKESKIQVFSRESNTCGEYSVKQLPIHLSTMHIPFVFPRYRSGPQLYK
jgi:hypothetical protein